jgi:hypothetical protein
MSERVWGSEQIPKVAKLCYEAEKPCRLVVICPNYTCSNVESISKEVAFFKEILAHSPGRRRGTTSKCSVS